MTFELPPLFDYFATFLWALSGAIVGMHKRYDMAGVCVIALLAATGGSTLRDGLFLNQLPPVLTDVWYLPLILLAALVVRFFRQRIAGMKLIDNLINLIDALGVPAFAVVGMQMSLAGGLAGARRRADRHDQRLRRRVAARYHRGQHAGRPQAGQVLPVGRVRRVHPVRGAGGLPACRCDHRGLDRHRPVLHHPGAGVRYDWRTQPVLPDTEAR